MTIHKAGTEENSQRYLSLREVAQLYGYTRDHLGLMIRRGKLQGVRLGNYYATTAEWMDRYVQNHADSDHPCSKNKFSNKFRAVSKAESDLHTDPVPAVPVALRQSAMKVQLERRNNQRNNSINLPDLQEDIEKILKNNQEIRLTSAPIVPIEKKIALDHDFLILPIRKMEDFERQMVISKARNQK